MTAPSPSTPTSATLKRLYALSGNLCAFPGCKAKIVQGKILVGAVCHICAASPGGPRYNQQQTAAERHGVDNLILLCANHHRIVDGDIDTYTALALAKMKADHEREIGRLSDGEASAGVQVLLSTNQSGGIVAQNIETINILGDGRSGMPSALPVSAGMMFAGMADVLAHMGSTGQEKYAFNTERFVYLRLIPPGNVTSMTTPRLMEVFNGLHIHPMSENWSGTVARNKCGAMYYVETRPREIAAFTQGFTSGELWGMNGTLFQSQIVPAMPDEPDGRTVIVPSIAMEKLYVATLNNYVQVAEKMYGLPVPYRIELGVKGICHAYVSFPRAPAGFLLGPVYEDAFRRTYSLAETTREAMEALLGEYFDEFYSELVGRRRKDVMTDGFIAAHGLPRLSG